MSTLRVLLAAPPSRSRPAPWALFDDAGRCVQRGSDASDGWPRSERREAVLAAELVRIVALKVPPMPPTRLAAAVAFALEDQLATTEAPPSQYRRSEPWDCSGCVAARDAISSGGRVEPPFDRVIAEPALALTHTGWTWRVGRAGRFVRPPTAARLAVGASLSCLTCRGLVSALTRRARRRGPARQRRKPVTPALARWTRELGYRSPAQPPRWDNATPEAFAAAPTCTSANSARESCATRTNQAVSSGARRGIGIAVADRRHRRRMGVAQARRLAHGACDHDACTRSRSSR